MTTGPHAPAAPAASASPAGRLIGVDLARALALLGMVAVHVAPLVREDGTPGLLARTFSGTASVLFVLLAGVGLALMTGGSAGPDPARLPIQRRRIARRAGLLFLLGLLCGALDAPVAVILCHYGVLFLVALPFLALPARRLLALGTAWTLLGPLAVFACTDAALTTMGPEAFLLDGRLWSSPAPIDLLTPGLLAADLLVTGYYPVLAWSGFLLLGVGIGRAGLHRAVVVRRLVLGGAAAWAVMSALGAVQRTSSGVLEAVAAAVGEEPDAVPALLATLEPRLAMLVPDPLWLVLVAPHGGSPLEAVRAVGWACAVLGIGLALGRRAAPAVLRALAPLAGAGRATLSLYVGHLLLLAAFTRAGVEPPGPAAVALHWLLCLAAGLALALSGRRGPLEAAVARLSRLGEPAPAVEAARR